MANIYLPSNSPHYSTVIIKRLRAGDWTSMNQWQYSAPKWKEWWQRRFKTFDPKEFVFGAVELTESGESNLLGITSLQTVIDSRDEVPALCLRGLEVRKEMNNGNPRNRGIGSMLLSFSCFFSQTQNLSGLIINCTPGAENFYRKKGFLEEDSIDGVRARFVAKGSTVQKRAANFRSSSSIGQCVNFFCLKSSILTVLP